MTDTRSSKMPVSIYRKEKVDQLIKLADDFDNAYVSDPFDKKIDALREIDNKMQLAVAELGATIELLSESGDQYSKPYFDAWKENLNDLAKKLMEKQIAIDEKIVSISTENKDAFENKLINDKTRFDNIFDSDKNDYEKIYSGILSSAEVDAHVQSRKLGSKLDSKKEEFESGIKTALKENLKSIPVITSQAMMIQKAVENIKNNIQELMYGTERVLTAPSELRLIDETESVGAAPLEKGLSDFFNRLKDLREIENKIEIAFIENQTYIEILQEFKSEEARQAITVLKEIGRQLGDKQLELTDALSAITNQLILDHKMTAELLQEVINEEKENFLKKFDETEFTHLYDGSLSSTEILEVILENKFQDQLKKKEQEFKDWIRKNGLLSQSPSPEITDPIEAANREIARKLDEIRIKLESTDKVLKADTGRETDVNPNNLSRAGRDLYNNRVALETELVSIQGNLVLLNTDPLPPDVSKIQKDILSKINEASILTDALTEQAKKLEAQLTEINLHAERVENLRELSVEAEGYITKYANATGKMLKTTVIDEIDDATLKKLYEIKGDAIGLSLKDKISTSEFDKLNKDAEEIFNEAANKAKAALEKGGQKATFLHHAKIRLQNIILDLQKYEIELALYQPLSPADEKTLNAPKPFIEKLQKIISFFEARTDITPQQEADAKSKVDVAITKIQELRDSIKNLLETKKLDKQNAIGTGKLLAQCKGLIDAVNNFKDSISTENHVYLNKRLAELKTSLEKPNNKSEQEKAKKALDFYSEAFHYYKKTQEAKKALAAGTDPFSNLNDKQKAKLTTIIDDGSKIKLDPATHDINHLTSEFNKKIDNVLHPIALEKRTDGLAPQERYRLKHSFKNYKEIFNALEAKVNFEEKSDDFNVENKNIKLNELSKLALERWQQLELYSNLAEVQKNQRELNVVQAYMEKFEDLYRRIKSITPTAKVGNYKIQGWLSEDIFIYKKDFPGKTLQTIINDQLKTWGFDVAAAGAVVPASNPASLTNAVPAGSSSTVLPDGAMHKMTYKPDAAGPPKASIANVRTIENGENITRFYLTGQMPERKALPPSLAKGWMSKSPTASKFYDVLPHEFHLGWAMKAIQDHISLSPSVDTGIDINQGTPPNQLTEDHVKALLICAKYLREVEGRKDVVLFNHTEYRIVPTDLQVKSLHKLIINNPGDHFPKETVDLAKAFEAKPKGVLPTGLLVGMAALSPGVGLGLVAGKLIESGADLKLPEHKKYDQLQKRTATKEEIQQDEKDAKFTFNNKPK